jgi:formiminotetrahydrofolate cyclodeaminase
MAARFSEGQALTIEKASALRARLVELAEIELHAYEPLLEVLRLPREDPARAERVAAARSRAAESPLGIARATEEVAELASELARTGNPNLEGDALAGRILAEAACRAAARLVELNLPDGEADPRVSEALQLAERARELPD